MKKIALLLLAALMLFSLCSCESADYRAATLLLKSGKYEAAEQKFLSLGEFEDAPEKVLRCRYEQAKELLKTGRYDEAQVSFEALGSYRDSAEQVQECSYLLAKKYLADKNFDQAKELLLTLSDYKDAKALKKGLDWEALTAYFAETGDLTRSVSESCSTTLLLTEEALVMEYAWEFTETAKLDLVIRLSVDREENAALFGREHYEGFSEAWDAEAEGRLNLAEYKKGERVVWDRFDARGTSANGEKDNDIPAIPLKNLLSTALEEMTLHLESTLRESECGVTMRDLGFVAY